MYLIDTNVISELRNPRRSDPGVVEWYAGVDDSQLFISALTLGEIRRGIELLRGRSDLPQAVILENWLQVVVQRYSERILPIDAGVADVWGVMNAIRPVSAIDGLLAATAKAHGLILVTRNIADVEGLEVELLNPFTNGN